MKKLATLAMGLMLSMSVMANTAFDQGVICGLLGTCESDRQAFDSFSQAANQGDVTAQYNLGVMYANGKGVRQDYHKAVEWYTKAANQGLADAQTNLGYMYYHGYGVRQDYHQAFNWYAKAAAQNNAVAQSNIAGLYYNGQGVRQSYSLAKEWYGKACDNGSQNGCDKYRELNQQGH